MKDLKHFIGQEIHSIYSTQDITSEGSNTYKLNIVFTDGSELTIQAGEEALNNAPCLNLDVNIPQDL